MTELKSLAEVVLDLLRYPYELFRKYAVPLPWYLASFLRGHRQMVSCWPQRPVDIGSRVALFVHHDRRGDVQAFVRRYLEGLRDAGCDILFVTNSGQLQPEAMAYLQGICAGVLIRRNVGYDFGAMREGLEQFALPRANTELLLIANDSVYGPLQPLGPLLDRIDFAAADLWGATESWQQYYHLQSYFIAAGPAVFRHPAWSDFWSNVRPVDHKTWIITQYEVGLTRRMLRAGLRCAALWPYTELIGEIVPGSISGDADGDVREQQDRRIRGLHVKGRAMNPTTDLWRVLLQQGYPFLKRELLRENPSHVADVSEWRQVVRTVSTVDMADFELNLKRTAHDRAP